jgi:single-strand DNA-binding protein
LHGRPAKYTPATGQAFLCAGRQRFTLKERTEWHRIIAWRTRGEICGKYLTKGRQVYVEGKLQTRSWEKDGVTRYTTEIIASTVQFLGNNRDGGAGQGPRSQMADQGYPEPPMANTQDDDIPF